VGDIPFIQPLGHIHRGYTVLVACFQCSLFICKDLKLKGFEVRRVKENMKKRTITKIEGFEVQSA
jgi:hypothetical protein